jgi:fucose 4-O-acetylase-like acetyltransferase
VSKNRVSLSYVLIALAISAVAYLLAELASRIVTKSAGFLCWWGENALVLYLAHLLILGLLVLPWAGWWYADAPIWLAGLQLAVLLTATSLLAWWMHRRKVRVLL